MTSSIKGDEDLAEESYNCDADDNDNDSCSYYVVDALLWQYHGRGTIIILSLKMRTLNKGEIQKYNFHLLSGRAKIWALFFVFT